MDNIINKQNMLDSIFNEVNSYQPQTEEEAQKQSETLKDLNSQIQENN